MNLKNLFRLSFFHKALIIFGFVFLFFSSYFVWIFLSLPKLFTISDYQPPLLTQVYDRENRKMGEFFKERRLIIPYEEIPKSVIWAFVSAEDGRFFSHKGLNYKAIVRAFIANLKAGKKVQGGSTITQQLARTLLLSTKKTYTRKLKEAILALRTEHSLSKQDILSIYLNQIYLGHGAYGLEMASRTYFRKSAKELNLAEAALLAGLPKAPSRFSPVFRPDKAKSRQIYVLNRMRQEGYISEEEMEKYSNQDIKVFVRKDFSAESPYYLETVRRILLMYLESEDLLESGLKIRTAMDLEKQKLAQQALKKGLENLDKRQGFRAVKKNLALPEERKEFSEKRDEQLRARIKKHLIIPGFSLTLNEGEEEIPEEFFEEFKKRFEALEEKRLSRSFWFENRKLLEGKIFSALISKVEKGRIEVLTPWGLEIVALEDFNWAVPIEKKPDQAVLTNATEIFQVHDLVSFRVKSLEDDDQEPDKNNIALEFYQEPLVEGALLSFDLENSEIIALVGGYDYSRSQYNRAYQSRRQSGSVFKPFVYGAALEKGFHPNTLISDSPIVFSKKEAEEQSEGEEENLSLQDMWRPSNISDRFLGDILFRKALVRSLNVPTVRIMEKIGLDWVRFYVRRLGVFSPLNSDFTMALGSSSLTLYETLKAFSIFAIQGRGIKPLLIHHVEDSSGKEILSDVSLDEFFKEEIAAAKEFVQTEKSKWFKDTLSEEEFNSLQKRWQALLLKEDSNQLIPPSNSYVLMNLLEAVIKDSEGTARRARVLNRHLGGKTGTTDGYYDTWFVGSSPFISTGVWLGFDSEKTLGQGETGSRVALPVWIQYMEESHEDLPRSEFPIPEQVVFANIDAETGALVSSKSKEIVYQAFIEGSEPQSVEQEGSSLRKGHLLPDEADFIREDLSR